jgi:ubiquitin-like protein ATG12
MTDEAVRATAAESKAPLSDEATEDEKVVTAEPEALNDEAKNENATTRAESDDDQAPKTNGNNKVKVHFVAVGSAPIMKKTKFQIGADQRFAAVTTFLRKMLKMTGSGGSLCLYCNSAFVPSPDELVGDLNDCFSVRGELVIHYSLQEAWG